ncbi:MAG TPA: TlpA disulfide reductase family protein [Bacteroidota bacterium]|nr:TlpA disulfide reductase family protein [Bacteroidota bacterium]
MNIGKTSSIVLGMVLLLGASACEAVQTKKQTASGKIEKVNDSSSSSEVKKINANYGKFDFKLATLDGKSIQLSDYAGKVVLVNIWAPWCGPCRKETPGFANLYKEYKEKGFEIVGVAVNTNLKDVTSFINQYKVPWPNGIDDAVARAYGTYGLPDNYLFRADGTLIRRFIGMTSEGTLKPLIEEALKQIAVKESK